MASAAEASSLGVVRLGRLMVDLDAERVIDPIGQTVTLRPQALAVLRFLLANPGRLVTKDEVMQAVWPGIAVTDDSLVQRIGEIRRALGDEDRTLIETVPRRGYRLGRSRPPPGAPQDEAAGGRRWPGRFRSPSCSPRRARGERWRRWTPRRTPRRSRCCPSSAA